MRLLIYVLDYQDLLTPATTLFGLDGLSPTLPLGRAPDGEPTGLRPTGELLIADRWMSTAHAAITRTGEGDVLRDQGSRNGTFVNGERITSRCLTDGDLIEVGHSLLCYRVVSESDARQIGGSGDPARHGPTRTFNAELAAQMRALERVAQSSEPVLILAPTGAGKEHAAEMVHRASGRTGQYCPVDCGAVPESLFESTFFGHQRGAFTGATENRVGVLQRAHGGTVFLDELGNLPPLSQAKLLRVLEDGKVTPVGAGAPVRVDLRVVSATNRDLHEDEGFRRDLLARVAAFTVRLPPLARRREDLGVLVQHLLAEAGVQRASITVQAARALFNYAFPANIRELKGLVRTAALLAGDGPIDLPHGLAGLDRRAEAAAPEVLEAAEPPARREKPPLDEIERALVAAGGNVQAAARALGAHRRQLYRWIEQHDLSLDKYRP